MGAHLLSAATVYLRRISGSSTEAVLTRKVGSTFVINALGTIIAFGLQVLLARLLGATDFGHYIYVLTWINLLVLVSKLGLDTASLRLLPDYYSNNKWLLLRGFVRRSSQVAMISSLSVGVILIMTIRFMRHIVEPALPPVFYIAAVVLPLSVYLILQCAHLQAFQHIAWQAPQLILRPLLLAALLMIVAVVSGGTVSAQHAMISHLVATLAAIFIVSIIMHRALPEEYFKGSQEHQDSIWRGFAFPMLLITSFDMLLNQTDIIMVGSLLSTREAGIYSAASKITMLIPFAIIVVNTVTAPVIAQLYSQGKRAQLQRMMTRVAWGTLVVSVPLCLAIVVGSHQLLGLFGAEFVSGRIALIVLAGGRLVVALTGSVGYLMSMSGHQKEAAYILGFSALLNIALCASLIPSFGIEGAAISFAITATLWCTVMVIYAIRMTGINPTVVPFAADNKGAMSHR